MLSIFIFRFFSLFACCLAVGPTKVLAELESVQEFEPPPVFHASKILPLPMLSDPGYRIQDLVYHDGVDNRYELTTDHGRLAVESSDLLITGKYSLSKDMDQIISALAIWQGEIDENGFDCFGSGKLKAKIQK